MLMLLSILGIENAVPQQNRKHLFRYSIAVSAPPISVAAKSVIYCLWDYASSDERMINEFAIQ